MKTIPCAVSADLKRFLSSQDKQQADEDAAGKILDDMYLQTVSQVIDQIHFASYEKNRQTDVRYVMRGIASQLEDLLAEASHYMGSSNE